MISLTHKTALITGASSGIGAATAKVLAAQGAGLVLMARRQDRLDALAAEIQAQFHTPVFTLTADVRDAEAISTALHSLPKAFRDIDILVNNAGLALGLDPIKNAKIEEWDAIIDTNLKGLLYTTRAILPLMLARNSGHIVNITSISAHIAYAGASVYCATKSAVQAFTRALKIECTGTPLRVTDIAPGLVETEFSEVRFHGDKARAKQVYENMTPLCAEDIADAILYAVTRPKHVNVSELVLVANDQKVHLN
jgi:3-hydroxy acid dehydrogenase/malonic semialdehyde reductase